MFLLTDVIADAGQDWQGGLCPCAAEVTCNLELHHSLSMRLG